MTMALAELDDERLDWSGTLFVARGDEHVGRGAQAMRYQAGSISKHVMSVVVLALVARGTLDLDAPVARWLPDLPERHRPITLRQLLSQTSGIGHWGQVPGLPPVLEAPPEPATLLTMVLAAPLTAPPGERWRYSSPAFLVVAQVIEAATGDRYADLVAAIVTGPAGMTATTSGRFPVGAPDVAVGRRDGRVLEVHPGFTALPGNGDLWTTTTDLLRYSRALRSGLLLDAGAAAQLWHRSATLDPPDPTDRPAAASAYGFGTFLGRVLGQDAWFVPGDNPGYQSLLAYVPATDTDLVVLSNQESGVDTLLQHLTL